MSGTQKNSGTSSGGIPVTKQDPAGCRYNILPVFRTGDDRIFEGYGPLAERVCTSRYVMIDGYQGVFFDEIRTQLSGILSGMGLTTGWISTYDLLKPPSVITGLTAPYLGGDDPLFGRRTDLSLGDFFRPGAFENLSPGQASDIDFIIGPGAALASWYGPLIYADVPKDEIQKRARKGLAANLGIPARPDPKETYKTFYFVDWIVLNSHKRQILPLIDIFIDTQHPLRPVWMEGNIMRGTLSEMSMAVFRAKPWFEPGTWGGSWIREHIGGIDRNVINYAWSFELITPENGLLIESGSTRCEISFDMLMFLEAEAVLGDCWPRFGTDFPIRFDFLDTFDGGNLSLQCHPLPGYMKEHFREDFTQEEAYYILDTKDNASVYLGFRDDIDPGEFRNALENSFRNGESIDPEDYILKHPARKHDLFLIPPGTIHGSGRNNLVLEISSTPYIFTFKMYDWLRPDLDGKPRTLNISRGMENLCFERKGRYVQEHLISKPILLDEGDDWQLWHLPTHEKHLYDLIRYNFRSGIEIVTSNKCLVLNLVAGDCIEAVTLSGYRAIFSYAETFVIPAAAGRVRITNLTSSEALLVAAFVK